MMKKRNTKWMVYLITASIMASNMAPIYADSIYTSNNLSDQIEKRYVDIVYVLDNDTFNVVGIKLNKGNDNLLAENAFGYLVSLDGESWMSEADFNDLFKVKKTSGDLSITVKVVNAAGKDVEGYTNQFIYTNEDSKVSELKKAIENLGVGNTVPQSIKNEIAMIKNPEQKKALTILTMPKLRSVLEWSLEFDLSAMMSLNLDVPEGATLYSKDGEVGSENEWVEGFSLSNYGPGEFYTVSLKYIDAEQIESEPITFSFYNDNETVSKMKPLVQDLLKEPITESNYEAKTITYNKAFVLFNQLKNQAPKDYFKNDLNKVRADIEDATPVRTLVQPKIVKTFDSKGVLSIEVSNLPSGAKLVSKISDGDWEYGFNVNDYGNVTINDVSLKFIEGSLESSTLESEVLSISFYNDNLALRNLETIMDQLRSTTITEANAEAKRVVYEEAMAIQSTLKNVEAKNVNAQALSGIYNILESFKSNVTLSAPIVSKRFEVGTNLMKVELTAAPSGALIVYRDSSSSQWLENFTLDKFKAGTAHTVYFKYVKGDAQSPTEQSPEVSVSFYNDNEPVKTITENIRKIKESPIVEANVFEKKTLYDQAMKCQEQLKNEETMNVYKLQLKNIGDTISEIMETNPTLIIQQAIENIPSQTAISKTEVSSILSAVDQLESESDRVKILNKLYQKVATNKNYQSEKLSTVEKSLLDAFDYYDTVQDSTINLKDYNIIPTDTGYLVVINTDQLKISATWKGLAPGEFESWLTTGVISDLKESLVLKGKTLEIKVLSKDSFTLNTYNYSSTVLDIDFDDINYIIDNLSDTFEEMLFDIRYLVLDDYIGVLMIADVDKKDSEWTSRDKTAFTEYIKYSIAEPLVLKFKTDVTVGVVDSSNVALEKITVSKGSQSDETSSTYQSLEKALNKEYATFEDLKFEIKVSGTKKKTEIRMTGTNFKESYDEWQDLSKDSFETYLKEIAKVAMSEFDADTTIRVYDKALKLLENYTFEKDSFEGSLSNIEDYCNNKFRKHQGVYFEYKLTRVDGVNELEMKADVAKSSTDWKNVDLDELEAFIADEIAAYIIECSPVNLNVKVVDSKNASIKTFKFSKENFGPIRVVQKTLNDLKSTYEGLKFSYTLTNGSTVEVRMDGVDFTKSDEKWKAVNSAKFEQWLLANVADPIIKEFKKDVKIKVYDSKKTSLNSYTFKSTYLQDSYKKELDSLLNLLKKDYAKLMLTDNSSLQLTYKVTILAEEVVVTGAMSNYTSEKWTKVNQTTLNSFIDGIGKEASLLFGKQAKVVLTDNNGVSIFSKSVVQNTSNLKKTTSKYASATPNKVFINEKLIETKVGKLVTYTLDRATMLPLLVESDAVILELDNSAINNVVVNQMLVDTLKTKGSKIDLQMKDVAIRLTATSTATSKDSQIEIERVDAKKYNPSRNIAASNTYRINNKDGLSFGVALDFSASYVNKPNLGLCKYNSSTMAWEKTSAKQVGNQFVLESASNGIYAVMFTSTKGFPDAINSPYSYEILTLVERGVINGNPDGTFLPKEGITRAELAKMATSGLNLQAYAQIQSFRDVKPGTWFYNVIETARVNNIISGFDGLFRPNDKITKEEVVSVIDRANAQFRYTEQAMDTFVTVPSGSTYSNWAIGSITKMCQLGVIDTSVQFKGTAYATREETAAYIYKLLYIADR